MTGHTSDFAQVWRTCAEPGCYTKVVRGRCPKHVLAPRRADHKRFAKMAVESAVVCAFCHKPPTKDDPLTGDHIIPRAKGGKDVWWNFQALHLSCNSRKGSKTEEEMRKASK